MDKPHGHLDELQGSKQVKSRQMLKRQRVLLYLVKQAGNSISKLELTKWCFLLRHETPSGGGSAFYDFVPYQYGPFSFSIYQELDKLTNQSYLHSDGDNSVSLTELGEAAATIPSNVAQNIATVAARVQGLTTNGLLDYVYEKFPEFTVNSVRKRLAPRPSAKTDVYTAGYERCSVDAFLAMLVSNGIRRLIDVRMNPIARRYGFHKSTLNRLCGKLQIEYCHVPELGIHSTQRQALETKADYDSLFDGYEQTTLQSEKSAIQKVVKMVEETPSVLVCMEADPCFCHRLRLANEVARQSGLKVVNLRAA